MLPGVLRSCPKCHHAISISTRGKKFYPKWRNPFNLTDFDNVTKAAPSVNEQWSSEWSSTTIVPKELKAFDINRLPHHLSSRHKGIPVEVKYPHEKRGGYRRRLFGLYGLASGVDPRELFDSLEDLNYQKELRKRLEPDVSEFKKLLAEEEAAKTALHGETIKKITENLNRLPGMLEKFHANQEKKAAASRAVDEKKRQLLEDARERFGYYVDRRDPKFIRLSEERQEESKMTKRASIKNKK